MKKHARKTTKRKKKCKKYVKSLANVNSPAAAVGCIYVFNRNERLDDKQSDAK